MPLSIIYPSHSSPKTPMISPLAYIDAGAKLADNVIVHPFAYIGADVEIGEGCEIMPYASLMPGSRLGSGNKVYQGAVIGADPQDFRWKGQPSGCVVGNDNIIREHAIINRSIHEGAATSIGNGCFIMAEAHVGHDTKIEDRCVLGNGASLAGDVHISRCTILSSNAIINEGVRVGKFALVKGGCRVSANVPPYAVIAHNPAKYYGPNIIVMRRSGCFSEEQLDDIVKSLRHLYNSTTTLFNAVRRIEDEVPQSEVRDDIISFVRDSNYRIVADNFTDK